MNSSKVSWPSPFTSTDSRILSACSTPMPRRPASCFRSSFSKRLTMSGLVMIPSPSWSIMWKAARQTSSCRYCCVFIVDARNSVQLMSPEPSMSICARIRCISTTTLSGAFSARRALSTSSMVSEPDMSLSNSRKICLSLSIESSLMERAMTCSATFFSLLLPTKERICASTSSSICTVSSQSSFSLNQLSCRASEAVYLSGAFMHIILLISCWAESETLFQIESGLKAYLPFFTNFNTSRSSV
mmetsp:Transcript_11471/g.32288  ORF Transcript_11471/g.32288 Transcript_11471/m.32288 type:complete len:244 (+) Transcript_11471:118-849(+)